MFDFKRVDEPAGWVSEKEACKEWLNSSFREIDADAIESLEDGLYLRCRDLPEEGSTISRYGEYGREDRFAYTVREVDLESEVVIAEDEDQERI